MAMLVNLTQDSPLWAYSKRKLPNIYLSPKIMNEVRTQMKLIVWSNPGEESRISK